MSSLKGQVTAFLNLQSHHRTNPTCKELQHGPWCRGSGRRRPRGSESGRVIRGRHTPTERGWWGCHSRTDFQNGSGTWQLRWLSASRYDVIEFNMTTKDWTIAGDSSEWCRGVVAAATVTQVTQEEWAVVSAASLWAMIWFQNEKNHSKSLEQLLILGFPPGDLRWAGNSSAPV